MFSSWAAQVDTMVGNVLVTLLWPGGLKAKNEVVCQ